MRTRGAALLPAMAAVITLSGCGLQGASTRAPGSQGASTSAQPATALLTALRRTVTHSVRADIAMDVTVTGQEAITMHAQMHVAEENGRRIAVTATANLLDQEYTHMAVAYDGGLYESINGGRTFKKLAAHSPVDDTYNQEDALNSLESYADVTDQGSEVTDGLNVEEYSGTLDRHKLQSVVHARLKKLGVKTAALEQALSKLTGTIDATIDQDGHLVTEDVTFDTTLRCGCGRQVELHEDVRGHFYDYGAAVKVQRPKV